MTSPAFAKGDVDDLHALSYSRADCKAGTAEMDADAQAQRDAGMLRAFVRVRTESAPYCGTGRREPNPERCC